MSKSDQDRDRQVVLTDLKNRIIELAENNFALPETDIYDEPVRYFKANLKWTPIIFGWLTILQTEMGWPEAEDTNYRGIQALLKFEEGIDMTLSEDISSGIYKAFNDLAKQIVSGRTTNIAVDTDGNVSTPTTGSSDAGLPVDDPLTEFDETEAARYGAMAEIAAKLELVLDKIDAFYGTVENAPITLEADAKTLMKQYFICDQVLMDTAITNYYAYRVASQELIFNTSAAFTQYLYCNGYQNDALNRWLQDVSGYVFAKQQIIAAFWESLGDEFFSFYFAIGAAKPSNVYLDAACVPIADQSITNVLFAVARATTPFKASHRMKFKITGYALDVDGDLQDAFWYRTAAGVNTRTNWSFTHGAPNNLPSDNQIVYNAAHVYEYTIDLSALNAAMVITANKNAGMNSAGLTYPTPFTIEITDLGLSVSQ